jgi:hypothetical protein
MFLDFIIMLNFDSSLFEQSILGNQLQPSSLETTTFHKSKSVARLDKISNVCKQENLSNRIFLYLGISLIFI